MKKTATWINENPNKTALFLYAVFFALLFLQFPLKQAISGNCDTWLALTYSNHTLESVKSFLSGQFMGKAMYPVENPLAYGESAPGAQLMIIAFKMLGFTDIWTNYFYISLIFILTAYSIFVFTGNFVTSFYAKLFSGLVFTCNNMTFAHIDDSIIVAFFIAVTSLHFLYKWFEKRNVKHLVFSALLAGIQVYFAFYVFLYLLVIIVILSIVKGIYARVKIIDLIKPAVIYCGIVFVLSFPHVLFYLHTLRNLDFVNPFGSLYTTKKASLNPVSMILVLPDNLIWPDLGQMLGIPKNWGFIRHYCFTGLLATVLFLISLGRWNKHRLLFSLIAFTGVFLAMGPVFQFNFQDVFYSPLYIFYTFIPILEFLRVTCRAHFIFLFAISVSCGIAVERISYKWAGRATIIIPALFIFHIVENTPFPMISFDASYTVKTPEIYEKVKNLNPQSVILDLPSHMEVEYPDWNDAVYNPHNFIYKKKENKPLEVDNLGMFVYSWDNIFEYNREIIYTNWQTNHKLNSINGVNGYFPTPRMIYQYHINRLPAVKSFSMLKKWGVDYIVWHNDMKIARDKLNLVDLERSFCLEKIDQSGEKYLFKLRGCSE